MSGAHFNPVVSLADRLLGGLSTRELATYVPAQIVGGCVGAVIANLMFELDAVTWSTHTRSTGGLWLGEVVATFGLLMVILGVVRSGQSAAAPFAVGGYIAAAYWFTSSTSFANPAVTVGRSLTDTFAGIKPSSVPAFVVAQVVGGLLAVVLARFLYLDLPAAELVVPHDQADAAERFARQRLEAPARVEGKAHDGLPTVLFLCVHNAGRSQMALGWFNHFAGDRAVAWSGGSEPAAEVNPSAIAAMAEVGIDITPEFPKPWTDEIVRAADVVVTMGCGDACPLFPGKRYEDWELDDPAGPGRRGRATDPRRDRSACAIAARVPRRHGQLTEAPHAELPAEFTLPARSGASPESQPTGVAPLVDQRRKCAVGHRPPLESETVEHRSMGQARSQPDARRGRLALIASPRQTRTAFGIEASPARRRPATCTRSVRRVRRHSRIPVHIGRPARSPRAKRGDVRVARRNR